MRTYRAHYSLPHSRQGSQIFINNFPYIKGDLRPNFSGASAPPKNNGVNTAFPIRAQKMIADFRIAFSAPSLRDETTPLLAWQGDLPPIFSGTVIHPEINGVNTEFSIMARKTIADFQIAFSVSNLRAETR